VGALVAALAAYKDLSSPWKELLTYYNQTQDMSLRWDVVVERFAPRGEIDASLFEGEPAESPTCAEAIVLEHVSLRTPDGNTILDDLNPRDTQGAHGGNRDAQPDRTHRLGRAFDPRGVTEPRSITMAGHNLAELHQAVLAARIGYAHSNPYLFQGTVGDNLLMSLRSSPRPCCGTRK